LVVNRYIPVAMVAALIAVIVICPAMACTFPTAHACCHKHQPAQGTMRNCPLVLLENGKAAPLAVIPAAVVLPLPMAPVEAHRATVPVANTASFELYLRNRVLLI